MKAIRIHEFGGPEVLKLQDVPEPKPGKDQVVIAARAIGVNPVDTYIRAGTYGPRPMPWMPGFDGAGTVEAVGADVTSCRPGDAVYTFTMSGTYAQKILADANRVYAMPKRVSFAQAACVGTPGATAWQALFGRGKAQPGHTVLIHGATGGVGTAAVQLARMAGCRVFGTGRTEAGRKLVRQLGCHEVFDHRKGEYENDILAATDGKRVDLIIEMLANVNLDRDLALLGKGGAVVVVGNRGRIEIDPRMTMAREADIRGMTLLNVPSERLRPIHAALYAAMELGCYTPIVVKEMPLADAAQAHELIMGDHSPGNIVLVP